MNPRKVWTAGAIRKLARQRLKEAEAKAPLTPLNREPSEVFAPRPPRGRALDFLEETAQASEDELAEAELELPPPLSAPRADGIREKAELEWMWGRFEKSLGNRVLLAAPAESPEAGDEMQLLCETLGLEVVGLHEYTTRRRPSPATYIGSGTLDKIRDELREAQAAAIVMDAPLSPVQVRNMEEHLKAPVVDRQGVILAIFELHAKTKLAKMQVELARLKYLQPRLSGLWMGLSRQTGSKGGMKGRGLGETRLELDRRVVKDRIAFLTKKLRESQKAFDVQSARRSKLPRVALVGYTNAGKSTLMRVLTKADVEVEDKLFCTLDTTVRPLVPPTEPRILISDTVGFVRDLPHDLVASFRSTLREAVGSGLILHVVDVSHPNWAEHFETTESVLAEIDAGEIPRVLVLNKVDALGDSRRLRLSRATRLLAGDARYVGTVMTSALTREGVAELKEQLTEFFAAGEPAWRTLES